MGFKSYPGRYLSEPEKQARAEILRRSAACRLADTYIKNHLKFGGVDSNAAIFANAVLGAGMTEEETDTETLDKVLATVEHQMVPSANFTDCVNEVCRLAPYLLWNVATEKAILRGYRQEWPHDNAVTLEKLAHLLTLPRMQPFILPNERFHEERQQEAARNAETADSARKILEMTAEYYVDGEIKGNNDYEKRRIQKLADADVAFLNALSPEELNARYQGWKEQERQKALTPNELRAEIHAKEKCRLAKYGQFEPLPEFYENENGTLEPWSKKVLLRLGNEIGANGESRLKAVVR